MSIGQRWNRYDVIAAILIPVVLVTSWVVAAGLVLGTVYTVVHFIRKLW